MLEDKFAALSDWVVKTYPTSPGNGVVWRFTDRAGRHGVVSLAHGGDFIVVSDHLGRELTRINIKKVLVAIPFAGAEILVRYGLSRVWRIMASNRLRRDMIAAEWKEFNIESLVGLLEYGVVVAQRPDKDQE